MSEDKKNKTEKTESKDEGVSSGQATQDSPTADPKSNPKEQTELSKNAQDILDRVEKLSVLEMADLVKAMEDKFGVSASAPTVAAMPMQGAATDSEAAEEKSSFNVVLKSSGANKIAVIKAIREVLPELGLKDAKDLVDSAPKPVKEGVNKEESATIKKKLEDAGATVELS